MSDLIHPDWPAPVSVHAFTTTRNGVGHYRQLLPSQPHWLKQVHGNQILALDENHQSATEADASTTATPGQVCAILTADCLPVLFCNKTGTKVAVAHAGWRGLAAGVLEATVNAMDCNADDLLVWLGPAIGPTAFEVRDDVYDVFTQKHAENTLAFKPHGDRWLADLYQLARLALARIDVNQVRGGQYCTHTERDRFFSHRRDGATGRMATVIWITA